MTSASSALAKHFLIINSHGLESGILDKTYEAINYSVKQNYKQGELICSIEPRNSTGKKIIWPVICGDNQDMDLPKSKFLGNAILIQASLDGGIQISSSLTGLPPLYLYQDNKCSVISDSIEGITRLPCCDLHFDMQSVLELVRIGMPINHRTLFKEVRLIPAGSSLSIHNREIHIKESIWKPENLNRLDSAEEYLERMVVGMENAIKRMYLGRSFLSLTAGLDTRAILAVLVLQNEKLPTFTMSGMFPTIDALRAEQLSREYGLEHKIVAIDNNIEDKLPEFTMLASRYSGGLSSLEQAPELYFYSFTGPSCAGRLSGNLGNQIGRSGTEGTGMRCAPTTLLSAIFVEYQESWDERHWFLKANPDTNLLSANFLISRENLFAQLGNYSIGHEFAVQHTPYADRTLIEDKYREPESIREYPDSIKSIKIRDLRHRTLGQPVHRSFQCRLVQKAGGYAANCPINWGWTVNGGYSASGLYYGLKAFTDIVLGDRLDRVPGVSNLLRLSGIRGFSSFHTRNILYASSMQSFIKEVFHDKAVMECGLFDRQRLIYLGTDGLQEDSCYDEIVATLDLALAAVNFQATL